MNNNLESLNNYLFEELERLNDDESLNSEELLDKELTETGTIIANVISETYKKGTMKK